LNTPERFFCTFDVSVQSIEVDSGFPVCERVYEHTRNCPHVVTNRFELSLNPGDLARGQSQAHPRARLQHLS